MAGGGSARPGPRTCSARSKVGEPGRPASSAPAARAGSPPPPAPGCVDVRGPWSGFPPRSSAHPRQKQPPGEERIPPCIPEFWARSFRFPGREVSAPLGRESVASPREGITFLSSDAPALVIYLGYYFAIPLPGVSESERTGRLAVTLWQL